MKYLYAMNHRGTEVIKVKVCRETDHNVWYERRAGCAETRINKRTMIEGQGRNVKWWQEDNERLETIYQVQHRKRSFETKLEELAEAYDKAGVYDAVMGIDIKGKEDKDATTQATDSCGKCDAFIDEDADGRGWCALNDRETGCGDSCEDFKPVTHQNT